MLRHRHEFPPEGELPALEGATAWLNTTPLTAAGLRGHVVLVSFGTYTCINWIRSLPYVRAWADKYRGHELAVVGVQTPEFDFEGDLDNVARATKEIDVRYPMAVDNDFAVWRAFDNRYWPALRRGIARRTPRLLGAGRPAAQSVGAVRRLADRPTPAATAPPTTSGCTR